MSPTGIDLMGKIEYFAEKDAARWVLGRVRDR